MADDKSGSYGKRPLWQWLLIYLIIGGIIYGLIYYFFLRGASGNPSLYSPTVSPTSILEQVSPTP